jgi:carbon storage regulator
MLVLSRQRDESIMIGDDVEITIVDVRGDKVRLGITAPKHIPVHRREIYDAIQREKAQKTEGEAQGTPGNGQTEKTEEPARKKSDKTEKTSQKHQE